VRWPKIKQCIKGNLEVDVFQMVHSQFKEVFASNKDDNCALKKHVIDPQNFCLDGEQPLVYCHFGKKGK
jgi:hypothetical protein